MNERGILMSKVILITGASTGIGAATAIQLSPGNHVIVHYNSSKEAAVTAEYICADLPII